MLSLSTLNFSSADISNYLWKQELFLLLPEIFIITALMLILVYAVSYSTIKKFYYPILIGQTFWLSVLTLAIGILLVVDNWPFANNIIFYSNFFISPYSQFLKVLILLLLIVNLVISSNYLKKEKFNSFEFIILYMLSGLGFMFLVSSNNLLSLFLSLELQSLSFYILTSYKRSDELSVEAGLKYFVFGSFSSGILLFGASLLYGITGSISFSDLSLIFATEVSGNLAHQSTIFLSLLFIFIGFLFKMYAAPFYVWVPDIYQGSPTNVTTYFATTPILGVGGIFVYITSNIFYEFVIQWNNIFLVCCILSMIIGALAACFQKQLKRLIAYSSIHHVGFFLLAAILVKFEALQSFFFYIIIYVITMVGFFSSLMALRKRSANQLVIYLKDLTSLYKINPILAITIAIYFFSMAGFPPLAGFFSKLYVFMSAIENSYYFYTLVGVITSSISAFYYLNIVKIMYFENNNKWTLFAQMDKEKAYLLAITTLILVFFFIHPSFLLMLSAKAALLLLI